MMESTNAASTWRKRSTFACAQAMASLNSGVADASFMPSMNESTLGVLMPSRS